MSIKLFNDEAILQTIISLVVLPRACSLESTAFLIMASYLIGSFPTGYLIGRCCGIDIRQHGSGNIGATNVVRVLGKKWGGLVFVIDLLKGGFPVMLAMHWGNNMGITPSSPVGAVAGFMAIIGHSFPIWLRFRGGKGVATSLGVMIALFPAAVPFCLAGWVVVFFLTGYVSLASILAAVLLPLMMLAFYETAPRFEWPLWLQGDRFTVTIAFLMGGLVVWRHRSNVKRLLQGTEHTFKK